jgi:diguanylate cyclase (GGDEF)-like protein
MKIILSLSIVSIYWFLDSYQVMQNLNISYLQAVILDYNQVNYFIKFLIVALFFIVSLTPIKVTHTPQKETNHTPDQFTAISKISDIILSPVPLHKQLNSVVAIMEKELKVQTSFIASFEHESILLLNTNDSLKKIGIKEKYLPHHDNLASNSLDNLLSICFLEKRGFFDDIVIINGKSFKVLVKSYKSKKSNQKLGLVAIVLDSEDNTDYSNFLLMISEQIAFTVELTKKKEEAIKAQNRYNAQFSSIDTQLNIAGTSKLQEMINHEVKRSQRYGTKLSLILIEIDHMKNLSNIFSEDETICLKKDIASVLKRGVRETDLFGKWNDEHFAIVAPDIDFRAAKSFVDKLNRNLQEHRFSKVGKITCTYGITSFSAKDTIGELRKRAESALKVAHERGGNSIEVKILV